MIKQLSVFVENQIGSVAKVTSALRENQINIRAISAFDSPDFCILRLVVDQTENARDLLAKKGFAVKVTDVLAIELKDKPGSLDHVLTLLAEKGFNVNYIYSFVLREGNSPLMVMNIRDMEKARQVLKDNQINVIE